MWRYIYYNLTAASAVPILAVAAWYHLDQPVDRLPLALVKDLLLVGGFLLVHDTANQATSAEEDRLNTTKPLRPIPSGLVTVAGTHQRFVVYSLMYVWLGVWWGIAGWLLLWVTLSVAYNYWGWARNWVAKSAYAALGCVVLCPPAWAMVGPLNAEAWCWIGVYTAYWALNFIQDLRDVDGDRAVGRRTLPIILGLTPCRWILAAAFTLFPVAVHLLLLEPDGGFTAGAGALVWEAIFTLGGWWVAWRVIARRTPHADHNTYLAYSVQAAWLLAGPFFA
ncbi:UbiA family prenyltransferase [Streptomyces noursei]